MHYLGRVEQISVDEYNIKLRVIILISIVITTRYCGDRIKPTTTATPLEIIMMHRH